MEQGEHELVMTQLKPLDGGRRAFRLVNGVLMERTVGEVLPELADTSEKASGWGRWGRWLCEIVVVRALLWWCCAEPFDDRFSACCLLVAVS
jgi:hypothetical protein